MNHHQSEVFVTHMPDDTTATRLFNGADQSARGIPVRVRIPWPGGDSEVSFRLRSPTDACSDQL